MQQSLSLLVSKWSFFQELLIQHIEISLIAIVVAIVVGGVSGVLISEYQKAAKPTLSVINFLYTIPSISMLGFLIPLSGIGNATAIIALIIYALLPMVRSTYTGITSVDPAIIEAAKGMGSTLAASPDILLMDEPFGAVDAITREQLQKEIKRIHQETGITILFVTHDIEEALNLETRVLVLDHGVIQQYAEPDELLRNPSTEFVERLVHKQRRACYLPEERLEGCEFSGAARACANDRKAEDSSSVPL